MKKPRYKVVTTEGWTIRPDSKASRGPVGLTASVLDTAIIHREVARFRSEDVLPVYPGTRRGVVGAIEAALAYADKLNAGCEPASAS